MASGGNRGNIFSFLSGWYEEATMSMIMNAAKGAKKLIVASSEDHQPGGGVSAGTIRDHSD